MANTEPSRPSDFGPEKPHIHRELVELQTLDTATKINKPPYRSTPEDIKALHGLTLTTLSI
ncbi:hypothetical protein GHT07_18535 [Caenimonas koreensis DSM 17982]|uniref:Uncharacterized protein n=1 Tax=Caenimonas koreensis DSM 17982 TaxID=1121255 RepID=A0A844BCU9_9BURK|nr:hypothetical protein [Caenimonas koreensis]MRD49277.1 hypothetical protein [Caenimonas koreensis DSM 17982]